MTRPNEIPDASAVTRPEPNHNTAQGVPETSALGTRNVRVANELVKMFGESPSIPVTLRVEELPHGEVRFIATAHVCEPKGDAQ